MIPRTLLFTAPSMTDSPGGMSRTRWSPSDSMYVTFAMRLPRSTPGQVLLSKRWRAAQNAEQLLSMQLSDRRGGRQYGFGTRMRRLRSPSPDGKIPYIGNGREK